ncbi:acetyl-CoA C-acetyltransferase [Nocardioides nematodiphilus]|uniref:acetyl-CoA C-acetyltransferase n=1 Tax=Nocardioides nematodiphilus TaxID=2849669 RepID=UPI001CD9810C|nr:acetyl-CoA C-acetyltransferase [Nocardioides nematodiphilus]MCA1982100.1 acetyl-CoA C-acetyltransferase [Nocardioides nematodiphilus]
MPEAFIVDAVRTPVGKRGGSLAAMHSLDLGAHSLAALMDRTGVDPGAVDDVILGCCDTIGPQAGDIARLAWLSAGLPEHVPGVTIDRQCGSAQQAVHFAAQGVMSGTQDLVVAGGVQNMSAIPISSAMVVGQQFGFETIFTGAVGWEKRYGDQEVSQFRGAELIADRWSLSREELEGFSFTSHERARAAIATGRFAGEIAPVTLADGTVFDTDECPRQTSLEKMAALQPLSPGGRITAGVASQISDGSAALLIASERAVSQHGLTPRARIHHLSVRGDDPVWMLTGPIAATQHALAKAGMSIEDIDLFECNEAFAPVVLAWMKETGAPHERVNVNGGGIALGHPIGATGARLMTTLLAELERTGGRYGLQTMCEGGGQANVTIIERL